MMDVEEAFKKLGLTSAATREEIKAAYRQKSKAAHPDVAGGTPESQAELGEAKRMALDHSAKNRELIAWEERLPALEQSVNTIIFRQQVEGIKNSIKRKRSSRLVSMKTASAWAGLLFAGSTALVQFNGIWKVLHPAIQESNVSQSVNAEKKSSDPTYSETQAELQIMFGMVALMFGIIFAFLRFRIDSISSKIDDYNDSLSSSITCAHELATLMKYVNQRVVDLQEIIDNDEELRTQERIRQENMSFRQSLREPPKSPFELFWLSSKLTVSEKAPLVFKRAQEHKLIRKLEFSASEGKFRDQYEVLFSPVNIKHS